MSYQSAITAIAVHELVAYFRAYRYAAWFPQHHGKSMAFFSQNHHNVPENQGWQIGHVCYDYKNLLENLTSQHPDHVGFPLVGSFSPQHITMVEGHAPASPDTDIILQPSLKKMEYIERVNELLQHIRRGDIYEATYSMEHAGIGRISDPLSFFMTLYANDPSPQSVCYKWDDKWLLCLSPERYLRFDARQIISQPIKGTARRSSDQHEDKQIAEALTKDRKERAENVMITDLVRNDLSRIAISDSVKVDELCGLYSYKHVHQLISTIRATLRPEVGFHDILQATFPMGSMTGAPKVSAMKLIDQYETFSRNLYSGSVFVQTPEGVTDMNVVIRSLLYNSSTGFATVRTGGAITILSDPEMEYEECKLKAHGILKFL